jgi:hypothetical protein
MTLMPRIGLIGDFNASVPAMRTTVHLALSVLACSVLALACQNSDPAGASAPTASAVRSAPPAPERTTAAVTASALSPSSPAPSSSVAVAAATSSAAVPGAAPPSAEPPSSGEWETAKEVVVTGSTALGCETKRVRDWVRVQCAKPNDAGGTPVSVKLQKTEVIHGTDVQNHRKNVKASSDGDAPTLIAQYIDGADVEALFSWTDKEKVLVLWWPGGKPEPRQLGAFK